MIQYRFILHSTTSFHMISYDIVWYKSIISWDTISSYDTISNSIMILYSVILHAILNDTILYSNIWYNIVLFCSVLTNNILILYVIVLNYATISYIWIKRSLTITIFIHLYYDQGGPLKVMLCFIFWSRNQVEY